MTSLLPALAMLIAGNFDPVRVGFGEANPFSYTDRNGRPAGFVVDVLNEAARREGIRLDWVHTGSIADNTKALADGTLHLLPLAVAFPERKRLLFVSAPWWAEETILLVRGDSPEATLKAPRRLALPALLVPDASEFHPEAARVVTDSAPQALEQVCRNTADAALLGASYIRDLVNARPRACESVPLQTVDAPVLAEFSVIANPSFSGVAERLRARIDDMTADGTLARIAGRHPPISTPHAASMAEALRARYESQRLRITLISLLAFIGAGVFILVRQIRSKRNLRRIVAQQQKTEQELRDSQAALHQRTTDLLRSNEDLQAFAYSVSHDLQEPVRNQALYSELLERRYSQALTPEARDFLRVIRANALRTQDMMTSLLRYSRAGQADRDHGRVDCNAVLQRVVDDLRPRLEEACAEVKVDSLPTVWGWEDRLQQVFQNLIENAAKYRRPDTPPRIHVSAVRNGDEWLFSVADNGIGFKQQYAERVFGLFKRLHGSDYYGGSGIGLALCKRIVDRHGGKMWATSEEGRGSTFYFTIPANTRPSEGSRSGQERPAQQDAGSRAAHEPGVPLH